MPTIILVGNGLGRSIDNNKFDLKEAIKRVWDRECSILNDDTKRAILSCIPVHGGKTPNLPYEEDQLLTLHEIANACNRIKEHEKTPETWLTPLGCTFQQRVNYFLAKVAKEFRVESDFLDDKKLSTFLDNMSNLISKERTHIATLNYDNILYSGLQLRGLFKPLYAETNLVDGFSGTDELIFHQDKLSRWPGKNFGWYLHLHGSPLFVNNQGGIVTKLRQNEASISYSQITLGQFHPHLVLCHTEKKPEIISGSSILGTYWDYYRDALDDSSTLIIVGYGGKDTHVNRAIRQWVKQKKQAEANFTIKILCRKSENTQKGHFEEWKERLDIDFTPNGDNLKIVMLDSVLDYEFKED